MKKNTHAQELAKLGASKGGRARAEKLTPAQRSEIASDAAKTRWGTISQTGDETIRKALYTGEINIGEIQLPCAVLEDGTRLITELAMSRTLGRGQGGKTRRLARKLADGGPPLPTFLSGKTLEPFVPVSLRVALSKPIAYQDGKRIRYGVEASLIPEICDVWLDAKNADNLQVSQLPIAAKAEILMRGLAHIGIIALVDEATGYQYDRDRSELNKILEKYIVKELLPWTKMFPDEFYEHLFRLRGWEYSPMSVKRPKYVGKLTNQLVYEKMPPGILEELKKRNPAQNGRRKHKHFQYLTDDIGNPHLKEHLAIVTTLMRISDTWNVFKKSFDRAFGPPSQGAQLTLTGIETTEESEE